MTSRYHEQAKREIRAEAPPKEPWSWTYVKDKLIDISLLVGIGFCLVLLYLTAGKVMMHVAVGIFFAFVAAGTIVKGQLAERTIEKLLWYIATGMTACRASR